MFSVIHPISVAIDIFSLDENKLYPTASTESCGMEKGFIPISPIL